ncbi:DUF4485 domain-containing protein [Aphis craccivora]|uniref:DUF4485 domain-containing protein n=1 Tax=Aphis craccivora TaxID=307492 RepID=A0A6G0ZHV2_APHCR|nr:DUF4485 domain-containing protein [Aphis craccivora]
MQLEIKFTELDGFQYKLTNWELCFVTAYTFQTVSISREKLSKWIRKLDKMNDGDDQLERLHYIKLSGSFGKVKPFSSIHPLTVQPLQLIIPPVVFADLLKDEPEPC